VKASQVASDTAVTIQHHNIPLKVCTQLQMTRNIIISTKDGIYLEKQ